MAALHLCEYSGCPLCCCLLCRLVSCGAAPAPGVSSVAARSGSPTDGTGLGPVCLSGPGAPAQHHRDAGQGRKQRCEGVPVRGLMPSLAGCTEGAVQWNGLQQAEPGAARGDADGRGVLAKGTASVLITRYHGPRQRLLYRKLCVSLRDRRAREPSSQNSTRYKRWFFISLWKSNVAVETGPCRNGEPRPVATWVRIFVLTLLCPGCLGSGTVSDQHR